MKKHIVIDARLYGPKHTGIGRYTKNLLINLAKLPDFKDYKFTLLVYPELINEVKKDLGNNFFYETTNIRHYTFSEQLLLFLTLLKLKADLIHFTSFNAVLFLVPKSVVTIHDLIKLFSVGVSTSTKNIFYYLMRLFGYIIDITYVILFSKHIIVPSNFWRDYIIKKFKINPKKITTTYEAVDPDFVSSKKIIKKPSDYIIYTGNAYPHKNIELILKALKELPDIKLKIIGARNVFTKRIEQLIEKYQLKNQVENLGYIPDNKFANIYSHALALVHPSFLEGFSLTGLEAMKLNCPVISSNTSCLPEIYGDSVLYFDPKKSDELVSQIKKLKNSPILRNKLIKLGQIQIKKYSWTHTAQETFRIYRSLLLS